MGFFINVSICHFSFKSHIVWSIDKIFENDRDLTILGRERDDDGQNKLLQINGSKDNSSYIINRMDLIQS